MPRLLAAGMSEMRAMFGMSRGPRPGPEAAAWISIDPRTGELSQYPTTAERRIEQAYHHGERQVRLSGLGLHPVYETLLVDLGGPGEPPIQKRVGGGKRDVRRFPVPTGSSEVRVHVFRDRGWRISDEPVAGVTEERIFSLDGAAPPAAPPPPPAEFLGTFRAPTSEDLEERGARVAEDDRAGLVGLWEWCRDAETHDLSSLAAERWAVYSSAINEEIELAFRNGAKHADIAIGIRSYEVLFEGASMAGKQVDKRHKKRRFVRRRAVRPDEKEAALQNVESVAAAACAQDPGLAEAECVICAESFADTYAMPVVRLKECGHMFHGACVQDLADRRKPCPFCRAQVNWRNVDELGMFGSNMPAPPVPPPLVDGDV